VFVRDLEANTTTLVSRASDVAGVGGANANDWSADPAISADGSVVAFISQATNLHPDDGDPQPDAFVRDLQANTTTLVSRATNGDKGTVGRDRRARGAPCRPVFGLRRCGGVALEYAGG
jgi:hypothetical protein